MTESSHGLRRADSDSRTCGHQPDCDRVRGRGFLRLPRREKRLDLWTALFLATTVPTSVTGFIFFQIERFTPAIGVGIISLIVLAVAILGDTTTALRDAGGCLRHLVGRRLLLQRLCPRRPAVPEGFGGEGPRADAVGTAVRGAQLFVLVAFIAIGVVGTKRFRVEPTSPLQA